MGAAAREHPSEPDQTFSAESPSRLHLSAANTGLYLRMASRSQTQKSSIAILHCSMKAHTALIEPRLGVVIKESR